MRESAGTAMHVPYLRVVPQAAPAAGSEFVVASGGGTYWRLISLRFILTTDANAANRIVTLLADDNSDAFWQNGISGAQVATTAQAYSVTTGANNFGAGAAIRPIGWPDAGLWLYPGWRLRSLTEAIQAGDQYSDIVALVEEFHTGPGGHNDPAIPGYIGRRA